MTYEEFLVLTTIEKLNKISTIDELCELIHLDNLKIKELLEELINKKYITENNLITEKGLKYLEPYKVKRVILIAAGKGERLRPITENVPKPLVKVNGKTMIERTLDICKSISIPEIIIVVGYLSEQFEPLLNKYPNIKLVYNEKFDVENNITSAYLVRDKIRNSYVMEADLVINNEELIRKYEYYSNYLVHYEEKTDDWCFDVENGIIKNVKIGGENCYKLYGVSYYNEEDGKQLEKDLEEVYNYPENRKLFWDEVAGKLKKENYKLRIREINENDVVEIDSYEELLEYDKSYLDN